MQSATASRISSQRRSSFSCATSGWLRRRAVTISWRISSVHFASTRFCLAMRMRRSLCAFPYSAFASYNTMNGIGLVLAEIPGHARQIIDDGAPVMVVVPLIVEQIAERDTAMRPNHRERDLPGLQQAYEIRPRYVQCVRGLLRGQHRVQRHDLD